MIKFILKRLMYGFFVVFGVVITVFFIFHVMPGDPAAMMAGTHTSVETMENMRNELGLNDPLPVQLQKYLNDLSPVSVHENTEKNADKYNYIGLISMGESILVIKKPYFRRSFQSGRPVDTILFEHLEGTFWLAMAAMLFAIVFGVIFGVIAALYQNSATDHSLVIASILGISTPSFVAAALIALIFAVYLADYTGLNVTGQLWVNDVYHGRRLELKNLILPALTLGIRPLAIIVQLTRSSMLDVLAQDYIRTARAKGLGKIKVIYKHALKNALNPVITAVSGWLASLFAGAFFVEVIFYWKGLGTVTINSVLNLDFPVVMGSTILVAFIFVIINILVDVLYAWIDPRVRLHS